jgi:hypothetical protein
MPTPQRQQIRILMRVVCEDWFCLTTSDDSAIDLLIETGHLALGATNERRPHGTLVLTTTGWDYLRWLIADRRHTTPPQTTNKGV